MGISQAAAELGLATRFFQTNHEGAFVEHLHGLDGLADAIILNPGAWTHYSYAIRDALELTGLPAVEVHLSNVDEREPFRRESVIERSLCRPYRRQGPGRLSRSADPPGARSSRAPYERSRHPPGREAARDRRRSDARHLAGQRPLPDRLHRLQRDGPWSAPTRGRSSRTSATSSSRPPRSTASFDRTIAAQELLDAIPDLLAARRAAAGLRGRPHERPDARPPARAGPRGASSSSPAGTPSSRCARSRTPMRSTGSARRPSSPTPPCARSWSRAWPGAPRSAWPSRWSAPWRTSAPSGPRFTRSSPPAPHGALPHAQPRDVEIGRDELVVIDWGAELDGYCSDCTRTLATGDLPDATLEAYDLVRQAQLAGLDAVAAGAGGREVDAAAREVIGDAGHAEHFGHGLGHGVGHGDPRGAAAVAALGLRAGQRQRGHGRARASTCPGSSGCGSRIWSS